MIPKIIHQTAKNKKLSWEERMLRKRAMKLMPDYDFKLYDDQENRAIVAKHFPEYLSKYDNINKGVAKADVIRLIYMYLWGGGGVLLRYRLQMVSLSRQIQPE